MLRRLAALTSALALTTLPALASDVDADWHFLGNSHALHAAGTVPLSRFFSLGATGWLPLGGGAVANPYMVEGRALFTIPMASLMGPGLTIAPWAGYRGVFIGSAAPSHGPGFGILLDMSSHDFPIGFDLQAGAYPFMQGGGPNWFEFAGSARYMILDWAKLVGGFRGYVPSGGGQALMGPFVGFSINS
jgi:hypothetical protein